MVACDIIDLICTAKCVILQYKCKINANYIRFFHD